MEFRIYKYVDQEPSEVSPEIDEFKDDSLDFDPELEDDSGVDEPSDMGYDEDEEIEEEDENFQGIIRTVPGACLVYKRRDEKNTYEELWIYNVGGRDIKPEMKIRSSILAGTDIDPKTQRSSDGQQTSETITVGNVQFLHIKGLIN
jgi:hypothetical protein